MVSSTSAISKMTKNMVGASFCGKMVGNTTVAGFVVSNTEMDRIQITKELFELESGLTEHEQSGLNETDPNLFIYI